MSLLSGLRSGIRSGLRNGLNPSDSANPMASVSRDATSGIYCPANATEWAATLAAAGIASGGPSSTWLCQEASGNLADSIGGITLGVTGTPAFAQAVAGWTRAGINYPLSSTARHTNSTTAPSAAAKSLLMLLYALPPAADVGLQRSLCQVGTTVELRCNSSAPARLMVTNGAAGTGTGLLTSTSVRPFVLRYNLTASTVTGFDDVEKLAGTFAAATGPMVSLASNAVSSMGFTALYAALFDTAAAELTDAQVKTLLQTLGYTIPWT